MINYTVKVCKGQKTKYLQANNYTVKVSTKIISKPNFLRIQVPDKFSVITYVAQYYHRLKVRLGIHYCQYCVNNVPLLSSLFNKDFYRCHCCHNCPQCLNHCHIFHNIVAGRRQLADGQPTAGETNSSVTQPHQRFGCRMSKHT